MELPVGKTRPDGGNPDSILCAKQSLCLGTWICSADEVYQRGFLPLEESHQSIELQEGYSLQLVLSEPQINEPVAIAWDGNGVLYMVEMLTYMHSL